MPTLSIANFQLPLAKPLCFIRKNSITMKFLLEKTCLFLIIVLFIQETVLGQDVVINEFVSSNDTIIQDIDGDFSDWIELYNLRNYDISLVNYGLSDNKNSVDKWVFPEVVIPANGYLLIFASGKDKFQDSELHANFKISQSGETLILSDDEGEIISEIEAIYVPTDNSYACFTDGSEIMIITNTATPNASNNVSEGIYCSHPSGFYSNSFELELVKANNIQQIYYTLTGETPTVNSTLYTTPITIENNSQTPYNISSIPTTPLSGPDQLYDFIWKEPVQVNKCNIIRFGAFENGVLHGDVYSKSYFVDSEIVERYEFPVVSLVTDSLNLFDYDTGIYIPGKRFDENGFNWWPEGNYHNKGDLWERDIHITYFENTGEIVFETDAGMRMRGNSSAANPQKSFNVYFRKEYGMGNIEYPIFNNSQAEKFKRLIFRNSGRDFLYTHFKDAMLQRVMSTMNLEIQDFQPAVVFFNGEYWGYHNIREKYDKYYFKYKYGIAEDDINILGICGSTEEGDNTDYLGVLSFISQNDLSIDENYSFVSNRVDIDNFIDFQIAEIYFANYDWPCNNYKIWKDNNPKSKWRFLIYDLDFSFGSDYRCSYSAESMEHATSTENSWPYCECSNVLFRKLLTNDDFKDQFLTRFADCLRNTFNTNRVIGIIDEFELLFANEVEEHIERWNYPSTVGDWKSELDILREYATKRPCYMTNNIVAFFNLPVYELDCSNIGISMENNVDLLLFPNPNDGHFSLYNNSMTDIENGRATLVNSIGNVVFTLKNISIAKNQKFYFHFNYLTEGVYILLLEYNNKLTNQKVVITSGY